MAEPSELRARIQASQRPSCKLDGPAAVCKTTNVSLALLQVKMARQVVLCIALLLSMAAAGAARPPVTPQTPAPPPAAFGRANASVSETTQLRDSLSVATVEAGTSRVPRPVQQAYLSSASDGRPAAGGNQTVRPIWPCVLNAPACRCACPHCRSSTSGRLTAARIADCAWPDFGCQHHGLAVLAAAHNA